MKWSIFGGTIILFNYLCPVVDRFIESEQFWELATLDLCPVVDRFIESEQFWELATLERILTL